jgi:peptidoglycan/xylan/chitin deacetylase (PgdA/CDA1 family)
MNLATLKRAAKRTLSSPLGWSLLRPLLRPPGVIVLMYHRILGEDRTLVGVPVEHFAAQMRWLRDTCELIHPDTLQERVCEPRRAKPAVLVTFDDGYRDYHDLAYPVLESLRIPALVFVATSFMDEGGLIWTDTLQWAAQSTTRASVRLPWSGETRALPDAESRMRLGEDARAHLKTLPDSQRREEMKALMAEVGEPPARPREMLTWDEVRKTMPLTVYGGHSHTHPILSQLDRAGCDVEVRTCRDRIASETGAAPHYFAYPNGGPSDYNAETQASLREHGFRVAYSTTHGIAGTDTDWMAVRRLPAIPADIPEFAWAAAGLMRSS